MATVKIGSQDHGREVHLGRADLLRVELPENPTTGYRWDIDSLEGPLELAADTYEQPRQAGIGASALRVLTLHPTSDGKAELRLKRWQSWEGESSVEEVFSCTLLIS